MTALIDWDGRPWPTDPRFIDGRFGSRPGYSESLAFAVEELGCIHLNLVRDSLFIAFRPGLTTRLSLVGSFYAIARLPARRFILVNGMFSEICPNADVAMQRMEAQIDRVPPQASRNIPRCRARHPKTRP
jgi:hypothetical protein